MVRDAKDAYHLCHALPIVGLMQVMGVPTETLEPREGEELFAYMIRLFPSFLEVLEEVWGPINAPSAAEILRLADEN